MKKWLQLLFWQKCYIWHKVHYSGCYKGGRPRQFSTSGRGGSYSKWSHCHHDCHRLHHVPTSRCIFVAFMPFSIGMDFLVKGSQVREWCFVTLQQTICKIAARNILAFGSTWKCTTSSFLYSMLTTHDSPIAVIMQHTETNTNINPYLNPNMTWCTFKVDPRHS